MIAPNISREYLNVGDGSFRDRGRDDYGSTVGGWVGGGIAFLFLVFIIFAAAFFLHSRHDGVENNVRDGTRLNNDGLVAAAYARGEQNVREGNILALVERISDKQTALAGEIREGVLVNRAATVEALQSMRATVIESAQGIVEAGRTFGFRTFDLVHSDPCRDRCDGRGLERGRHEFARLTGTFALPTATTPGTIDADINGRVV